MADVVGVFAVVVVRGQGWGGFVVMVGFVDAPLSLLLGDADSLSPFGVCHVVPGHVDDVA